MWQAAHGASATVLRQQLHWLPVRQRINYKLPVITYRTWSTGNPAYLHHLIHDYLPARTLRSSDKLLLIIPWLPLALSAKAFSVSAHSVWNSLSYNCRSAELLSTFKHSLKTELFDIVNVNTQPSPCHYVPLIRSRHTALYKCVLIDWLIDWLIYKAQVSKYSNVDNDFVCR